MFFIRNLLEAVIYVFDTLLTVYSFIVIAVCIISFVNPDPYNPIVRFLRGVTEPVLWRVRKLLPFVYIGGIDFSPLVLLILIQLIKMVIIKSLYQLLIMV